MNIPSLVLLIAIVLVAGLVVWRMIRDKKRGKSSCGCSCADCPMSGGCRKEK